MIANTFELASTIIFTVATFAMKNSSSRLELQFKKSRQMTVLKDASCNTCWPRYNLNAYHTIPCKKCFLYNSTHGFYAKIARHTISIYENCTLSIFSLQKLQIWGNIAEVFILVAISVSRTKKFKSFLHTKISKIFKFHMGFLHKRIKGHLDNSLWSQSLYLSIWNDKI